MDERIATEDKQAFLNRFLKEHRLQKRESAWILHYLRLRPHILEHVHFVRDISYSPRNMLITSSCFYDVAFLFRKDNVMTTDTEKAFHDIRLNKQAPLYIQLQFKNANKHILLNGILEENPYLPLEKIVTKEDKRQTESLLQHTMNIHRKTRLLQQIDQALDRWDKTLFTKLTNRLHRLESDNGIIPLFKDFG